MVKKRFRIKDRRDDPDTFNVEQYEEALLIDELGLEECLTNQADLLYRVSKRLSLLVSRRDALKQALSEEEARADADFRRSAQQEKEKVTETELKNMIKLDKNIKTMNDKLLKLNRSIGEMTALKEAFQQRSYVLNNLVTLYTANYYSSDGSAKTKMRDVDASIAKRKLAKLRRSEKGVR